MITLPLLVLSAPLSIPVVIDAFRSWIAPKRLKKTQNEVYDWKFIVGFIGDIGMGKTTKTNAVTTLYEYYMMDLIKEKEEYTYTIINKFDFTYLNHVLKCLCLAHDDCKKEEVFEMVYPIIKPYLYNKKDEPLEYNNGIKKIKYETIMLDYIEAVIAKHRNNFVWCNIDYVSAVTGNEAYDLSPDDTKIKDRWINHDFSFRRYGIDFFDDIALLKEKINLNWQKTASENSGSIEFLRTYRHLFVETRRYLCNLQEGERLVKTDRELFNTIVEITSKEDYELYRVLKRLISIVSRINDFIHKVRIKLSWNKSRLDEKISKYRNRKRKFKRWLDLLDSKDYIKYEVDVYKNTKDAANNTHKSKHTKLYFPKKWCYAPTDTHEYSYLYDALVQTSTVAPRKKTEKYYIEDKIALADKMLQK